MKTFFTLIHFLQFQKWPKINFPTGKKYKTAKNAISRKKFLFIWFDDFIFAWTFLSFLACCEIITNFTRQWSKFTIFQMFFSFIQFDYGRTSSQFIFTRNRNGVDNLTHNIKSVLEHFFAASWTFFDIGLAISTNNVSIFTKDGKIRRVGNLLNYSKRRIFTYFENSKRPKKLPLKRLYIFTL